MDGYLDEKPAENSRQFAWAMRPIIIIMKIFGLKLDQDENSYRGPHHHLVHLFWITLGSAFLSINIIINGFCFGIDFTQNLYTLKTVVNASTSAFLNNVSGSASNFGLVVGIHITFFAILVSSRRWVEVWTTIRIIQAELCLPERVYNKCRNACFFILSLFILDGVSFFYTTWSTKYWSSLKYLPPAMAVALGNISHMSSMMIQSVFVVMVCISAIMFRELHFRMEFMTSTAFPYSKLPAQLEKWRRAHELICRLTQQTSHCFGMILVITLVHGFVFSSKYTYQILSALLNGNSFEWVKSLLLPFITVLIRMSTVIIGAYLVQREGARLVRILRRLRSSCNAQMQIQLNNVLLQVVQSRPKVSAMHFTDVDLTIYPTLMGTTLTYAIILYQTKAAV